MQTDPSPPSIRDDNPLWRPRPTLGAPDYTTQEVYDDEREKIWWGDWVCAGRAEEIPNPGDYSTYDIAGESIFVTRNEEGDLRAFYNVCSHRGTKFVDDGSGHARKAFKCPYHAWTYDLNGKLIGTPNVQEDEYFDRSKHPLHEVAVDTYAGFMFVNMTLGGPQRTLMDAISDGSETMTVFERFKMDELRVGVRIVYEVEANWKIIVENYNECLHCPTVHPELVQVVPLFRFGEVWDDSVRDDGVLMRDGATSFTMSGASTLPKFPGLEPEDYGAYYGTFEFPNLMLNMHPDCVMYYIGFPKGPNHTTVVSEYLFRPETIESPDFDPKPVVDLWDTISKQDWEITARAQTGVGSRAYTTGIYPRQDRFLYWFNEEYRQAMGRELQGY